MMTFVDRSRCKEKLPSMDLQMKFSIRFENIRLMAYNIHMILLIGTSSNIRIAEEDIQL
jgi:hypothetical protein